LAVAVDPLGPDRRPPSLGSDPVDQHPLARPYQLTCCERGFGYAIVRAYAGHGADATATYVRASIHEVSAVAGSSPVNPTSL
jgi:hypothetical protein